MDRVLQAERDAIEALAECEREAAVRVEQARQLRRAILERAQARVIALHARAAEALERRSSAILAEQQRSAAAASAALTDPGRARAALERLAARLTTTAD